jgi:hypothetical protein
MKSRTAHGVLSRTHHEPFKNQIGGEAKADEKTLTPSSKKTDCRAGESVEGSP